MKKVLTPTLLKNKELSNILDMNKYKVKWI